MSVIYSQSDPERGKDMHERGRRDVGGHRLALRAASLFFTFCDAG
jgi:hypothetical protein